MTTLYRDVVAYLRSPRVKLAKYLTEGKIQTNFLEQNLNTHYKSAIDFP